jgi:hypothetical protein
MRKNKFNKKYSKWYSILNLIIRSLIIGVGCLCLLFCLNDTFEANIFSFESAFLSEFVGNDPRFFYIRDICHLTCLFFAGCNLIFGIFFFKHLSIFEKGILLICSLFLLYIFVHSIICYFLFQKIIFESSWLIITNIDMTHFPTPLQRAYIVGIPLIIKRLLRFNPVFVMSYFCIKLLFIIYIIFYIYIWVLFILFWLAMSFIFILSFFDYLWFFFKRKK